MRFIGVDLGAKRIGLAISDASATLARPWRTLAAGPSAKSWAADLALLLNSKEIEDELEPGSLGGIVVGVPHRLDGRDTHLTAPALEFAKDFAELTGLFVHVQDERLTSREAESQLAVRERDWRRRKALLDAASAAVILQEYLDTRSAGDTPHDVTRA